MVSSVFSLDNFHIANIAFGVIISEHFFLTSSTDVEYRWMLNMKHSTDKNDNLEVRNPL